MLSDITKVDDILTNIQQYMTFFLGMDPSTKAGLHWGNVQVAYTNGIGKEIEFNSQQLSEIYINTKDTKEDRNIPIVCIYGSNVGWDTILWHKIIQE